MLNLQLCNSLILFCALVSPCQGVKKVSISQSYTGQCDGDDETCVESCNDDKLCGGKCGAFRNVRVCYCEGCHQGETTRNRTPAPVRPSQDKEKLCFSKSYFGQCDGDDEACVQSCNDDKLSGGKCGAFGSVRVCFCEGRHQGVTAPNRTPAPVSPSQDKELCFSKSYFGQCDGDDEACVQSCNDDKLSGGKCGAYKSARICYCEGCHQSETVDCVNHHLYWTNSVTGIRRSWYDGSYNDLVVSKAETYFGLAVDFVSRNMFWVQGSAILVAKMSHLEAGHKTILSHTEIDRDSALAVHPSRGSIYWSHSTTTIETACMDGSNRQVLVYGVQVYSLALDYEANDLYWADTSTGNIECISLNGGGKRIVSAQGSARQYSYGISLSGGRVYWTSYSSTGTVKSITKSGSAMKQHSLPAGRSGQLYGIAFVPEQCPKLSNACAASNGGCPFICLPLPRNNKKCVCPDGNSSCTS